MGSKTVGRIGSGGCRTGPFKLCDVRKGVTR